MSDPGLKLMANLAAFQAGDVIQFASGFDIRDPLSRVRVHEVEMGMAFITPWMITRKREAAEHGKWVSIDRLKVGYVKLEDDDG